ncbi:Glutamate synthase [NADPH] large chain [hydrothermal vent metagenome]|uniref:Glutamate synthase [NADPH] large chain n=1 Tax=hydrothermal vent metagenome TaxID=652676 RepID=A0A3B0YI65_9ZZZZ
MSHGAFPEQQGLYDRNNEHDACGVGFIAHIKGKQNHAIVRQGLQILENLTHRGAVGADPLAGDGAGILIQTPDTFLREECVALGFKLPAPGAYAVGMIFLPQPTTTRTECEALIERAASEEGLEVLGWRDVPVDNSDLGQSVKDVEPMVRQVFIRCGKSCATQDDFERKLFIARKVVENTVRDSDWEGRENFYIPSFSSRTLLYKGMLLANQVDAYFKDLRDERVVSALALVHQRFSTNTFPSWDLAHPFRMIAHNGEINTMRGNVNWMRARRHSMASELFGDDLEKVWPLIPEGQSDSACFDNALELLVAGGYSMAHAMMMLIPEAWAGNPLMDDQRKAFYEYHAALMEPWDGPAAVAFTDGRQIGATLDRNGLRPARYLITDDDMVVMASEMGVLHIPDEKIVKKWRLQPGKMFLIDLEEGRIIDDAELKQSLATSHPYPEWLSKTQIHLKNLPAEVAGESGDPDTLLNRQQAFGVTQEDLKILMKPMAASGQEGIGSMGADNPVAVLSNKAKPLANYFQQNFAQVTNPPIDPIREELVMSLVSLIGPRPNLLGLHTGGDHMRLEVTQPILTNKDLQRIRNIEKATDGAFKTKTLDICYAAELGADGMEDSLNSLCQQAEQAVCDGYNILILSDRMVDAKHIAIPALLATSAVHHHLVRKGLRTESGLVLETGAAREIHQFATLAGYGAEAINPYLAFETLASMKNELPDDIDETEINKRYIKAVGKGLLKVFSKMGISTYQSYCGAQIFDAIGLKKSFIEKYFTGTASMIEGVGINEIAAEAVRWHNDAYGNNPIYSDALDVGGDYAYRIRGEDHVWTPATIAKLQHATRTNDAKTFAEFSKLIDEQSEDLKTLRGLFDFKFEQEPVPIDEVEPAKDIVKRFATGAMSFGSISWEAHTTLAVAMNRIGGKSNTGEGGEERSRFKPLENGDSQRSAIKQVASGRFGVTTEYLVNADDIQIKMAQGAKPGEGGQLPGHKVSGWIAKVRHSTPGVGLISPPPHHDIYSIEDLAQLIHDLKNVNPKARISVKLVSEVGVGTVAAGVSKAHADHVTIAGYDGGTGASPLTSIRHAGSPWELGLAETHQTLVLNKLRGRIAVQVDGGMRTGRDVVIGALLGADEFGFATAPLIVEGCIMMRKCHLNTCPVGVATQDEELRKRFTGQPEHVVNYFFFVAEEIRQLMAKLGFRTLNEMIGRVDRLDMRKCIDHWKAQGLDYSRILHKPDVPDAAVYNCETQDHGLDKALDNKLIEQSAPALERGEPVKIETPVCNVNRTVGAMLSGRVAERYGLEGLPDDTIHIKLNGVAGQSFGAWVMRGITLELEGEGNDYVGKGLSGGRLVIYPPANCPIVPEENIIVGNTTLYGAISGECYFRGVGGERFAVRNSGASVVVEGVGDHGCEYMTGGVVAVLGETGRNFAAGMSGGIAYVLDDKGDFESRCNLAMVDLEPIPEEDEALETLDHQGGDLETHGKVDISADMTRYDALRLRHLIEKHLQYTNSSVAKNILDNWNTMLPKFVKVMPVDYRRALAEMKQTQADELAAAS